jgi:hypothetical protein
LDANPCVQLEPFQYSDKRNVTPEPLMYSPTAVHAVASTHDTPFRYELLAPL